MYVDRHSQQIIYQTINQRSICSKIYPLNVKLNVLLSTTSNFLMCFPHNAFYVHNALFGDAGNKERTEGSVSSTATAAPQHHSCTVWTAEQQNRLKDLKLLLHLITDWWRNLLKYLQPQWIQTGMEDLRGKELWLSSVLAHSLCVCLYICWQLAELFF